MRLAKLVSITFLVGVVCSFGCKGDDAAAPAPTAPTATTAGKPGAGKETAGAPVSSLNPNYHSTPSADDARTGSALKGK